MRQVQAFTLTIPTADEISSIAKMLAAIGGLAGGAWTVLSRIIKRRRELQRRRELEAKAVRYLLDAVRHCLQAIVPSRSQVNTNELARQKVLIDEVRDMLWVADGHPSSREIENATEEIVKVLTRTQAIERKQLERHAKREAIAAGEVPMFDDENGAN